LVISYNTFDRLSRNGVYGALVKYAARLGFHDAKSSKLEDDFGPHCFRHWFTTWLLRNGMPREYAKELRGDKRGEAIDIYHHIDRQELRKAYLACIPKLGI
jgi:integrase/recombinase XerD